MKTFLNDSSFFMLVRLPGGATGRFELMDWFSISSRSRYRIIVDQEINITAPSVDALSHDYPGVRFMVLVSNPYRRAWTAYNSVLEAVEDPKFKALFNQIPHRTFEEFVLGLGKPMPKQWPFWWDLCTSQRQWAERNDVKVDYVLREEHLSQDMLPIREYFMRQQDVIEMNLDNNFMNEYTNEMKSKIEQLFDQDFTYFNYKKLSQ
jgi:hypothetical protein